MTQFDPSYNGNQANIGDPRRAVYPLRQTGYFTGNLAAGGVVYIEPGSQTAFGIPTDWLVVDRGILNAVVSVLDPFGGASLYVYLSPDGVAFNQTHIFYFPGNNVVTSISGLELFGFTARFRLHSGVAANTVKCYLNLRSV